MNISKTEKKVEALFSICRENKLKIAIAESCTGGLISALLTALPGSSDVMERGFVTYTNEAKQELLGVPKDFILNYGAVSEEVARAMAEGALFHSNACLALSVTGIAGPGGGSEEKPVGLVYLAVAGKNMRTVAVKRKFQGRRSNIRGRAAEEAIDLLNRVSSGS